MRIATATLPFKKTPMIQKSIRLAGSDPDPRRDLCSGLHHHIPTGWDPPIRIDSLSNTMRSSPRGLLRVLVSTVKTPARSISHMVNVEPVGGNTGDGDRREDVFKPRNRPSERRNALSDRFCRQIKGSIRDSNAEEGDTEGPTRSRSFVICEM